LTGNRGDATCVLESKRCCPDDELQDPRSISHCKHLIFVLHMLIGIRTGVSSMVSKSLGHTTIPYVEWLCLMSCTKTVLVESPCHPRLLLAVTRNLAPGSTTDPWQQARHGLAPTPHQQSTTLTHLRDIPSMMARYDFELHPTLRSPRSIRLACFRRIPETYVVVRGAATLSVNSFVETWHSYSPSNMPTVWESNDTGDHA
jgi:hypothetical protein